MPPLLTRFGRVPASNRVCAPTRAILTMCLYVVSMTASYIDMPLRRTGTASGEYLDRLATTLARLDADEVRNTGEY